MAAVDNQRAAIEVARTWLGVLVDWLDPGEPRPTGGPFTRWPAIADAVLALVVFLISVLTVAITEQQADQGVFSSITERPIGSILMLAVAAASLWWRRAHSETVTSAILGLMVIWAVGGYGGGHELALVVALYSVGRYGEERRFGLIALAAAIVVSIAGTMIDDTQTVDVVRALVLAAVPWYVGRQIRNRADTLALLQQRAAADERSRIARELHEVVAHRVSMMTLQAGEAKIVAPRDLSAAVDAIGDVEQTGRATMGELRHLMGALRTEDADDGLDPRRGIDGIGALAEELIDTGADVGLTIEPLPHWLPTSVDLAAFRIVQEAIANIVKHAGPRPVVDIELFVEGADLVVDITNTVDSTTPHVPGTGFGIIGMRERASQLGGSLDAGREPPSQYRVHARLPLLESDPDY